MSFELPIKPINHTKSQTPAQTGIDNGSSLSFVSKFSRRQGFIIIAALMAFGTLAIFLTHAATAPVATVEAEAMALPSGATIYADSIASSGQAVKFTTSGTATASFTIPATASVASLTVSAHGNSCHGWSSLSASVDGSTVIPATATSTTGWKTYSASVNLPSGIHSLSLVGTSIGKSGSCYRNLYVDITTMYAPVPPPTPLPTVTLNANPTTVASGASSILTWSSTNATSCTASGAWSGNQTTSGSVSTGAITSSSTYNLTCTGAGGSASASTTVTVTPTRVFGYAAHTLRVSDPDAYTALISNGGATTAREDFSWTDIEATRGTFNWSSTDQLMTYDATHGLHELMIADTTPAWARASGTSYFAPPTNASDYGNFVSKLVARYGANGSFWAANPALPKVLPAGVEIWNEPNLSSFWGNTTPDPVKYTALLKSAYAASKAVDPSMKIITAGLSPAGGYNDVDCNDVIDSGSNSTKMNGLNFLQAIYANGGGGSFDAIGYHPYNFSMNATTTQMLSYHLCSAWSQMAQTPVSVTSLMAANGDSAKKIWATELGVPTCITGSTYICTGETEQANLATQEVALWKSYSWSGNYYWYDIRDDFGGTSTTDLEQHFGSVTGTNSFKQSYNALKTAYTSP